MTTLARGRPLPLLGNVAFNVGARGALIVLTIISTPVILHRLGTAAFGIYILAVTVGGLLALLDFGLTPALITLLSRAWHQQRVDEAARLVGTALTLYLAIGVAGAAVFALLVPWAVHDLLHVPVALQAPARTALWLSTAGFAFNMWLAVFNAVPYALQRYDLVAIRIVGLSLLTTAALIVYALLGGVLEGFVLINVAGAVIGLLIFYLVSRSLLPGVRFTPRVDPDALRRLARFAAFKFAGTVGGIFTFRFDQFAVGAILGVSSAGIYSIPASAGQKLLSLLGELAAPFFPRASTLRDDGPRLRALFFDGSRLLALAATPMLLLLIVLAEPTLRFWIGGAQGIQVAQAGAPALRWLVAALLIQSTVVFIVYASRTLFHVSLTELLRRTFVRPLAAAALTAGLAYFAARPFIQSRLTLVLALVVLPIVYLGIAFLLSAITREDLARIPFHLPPRRSRDNLPPPLEEVDGGGH